jgi:hypothetical protein
MEDKKRRFPLNIFEVVLLVISIPVIFYGWIKLLLCPWFESFLLLLNLHGIFLSFSTAFVIVGFNILWLVGMYWLPFKNLRIKIYLTIFLLAISAATLTFWLTTKALSESMH